MVTCPNASFTDLAEIVSRIEPVKPAVVDGKATDTLIISHACDQTSYTQCPGEGFYCFSAMFAVPVSLPFVLDVYSFSCNGLLAH